jgi:protein Mpv17
MLAGLFAPVKALVRWHQHKLQSRPFLTNSLTSALLMTVGDRTAQHLEGHPAVSREAPSDDGPESLGSWSRTAILVSWSSLFSSPFWVHWYALLHHRLPNRQIVWVGLTAAIAPIFNAAFFTYATSLEFLVTSSDPLSARGRAGMLACVHSKLEARLWPAVYSSTMIWPAVNLVNFSYVPLHYRQLVAANVALGWNIYLSMAQAVREGQ